MVVYSVTDWADHFENNRTRELLHLEWLPLPNKMDGDGYTELVDHPDGTAHFGAWCALLEIASKCDPRGVLMREHSKPYDAQSLARVSRLSRAVFEAVIPRLIKIGWLTAENLAGSKVIEISQEGAAQSQEGAALACARRMELNGIEWKENALESNALSNFESFWATWPKHHRKSNRKACQKHWVATHLEQLAAEILDGLKRWKASAQWAEQSGRFVPAPLVWLHQEKWTAADALDPAEQVAGDNGFVRRPITREVAECIGMPWNEGSEGAA